MLPLSLSRRLGPVAALLLVLAGCTSPLADTPNDSTSKAKATIAGKALFSNSTVHAGILVSAEKTDGLRSASASRSLERRSIVRSVVATAVTADDGSYTLRDLGEGNYTIYAASKDSSERAVTTNVVLKSGRSVTAADLNLTAVGKIAGTVKLDDPEATTGNLGFLVSVAGTSYMAFTNDKGDFVISDVPAGEGNLVVISKKDYLSAWSTVTVAPSSTVSVGKKTVTTAELKAPVAELVWKGALAAAPSNPEANWVYYDSVEKKSYIWSAGKWQILAQDGTSSGPGGSFTVTFNSNGGSALSKLSTTSVGEEVLTVSKSNNALEGWYTSADLASANKVTFPYTPTADVTFYAKWIPSVDGISFSRLGAGYSVDKVSPDISGNLVIPAYWQGKAVTAIGANALSECRRITSASLPAGLTSIGKRSFAYCVALASISLPSSVTYIGAAAFASCSALASVSLPPTLTSIEPALFSDCGSLASITIPSSVTTIGEYAFYNTGLTTITIPVGVTTIETETFANCGNMTSISLPSSLTSIGPTAFSYSGLVTIVVPEGVASIGGAAFFECWELQTVTFPSTLVTMGSTVFDQIPNGTVTLTVLATTPPSIASGGSLGTVPVAIKVPFASVGDYQTNWSTYNTKISAQP